MKNSKNNAGILEGALKLGNNVNGSFSEEETIRGRIGHNMKAFLMAYCIDLGRRSRPSTIKKQWYALKDASGESLQIINAVQRRRAFRLLEKQGYLYRRISIVDDKKVVTFKFTEKGLELSERFSDQSKLEHLVRDAVESRNADSRTHVVSWDIPEALRKKRALFRHFVKSLGFQLLHKSFFIGNSNVAEFFARAAKLLEIEKYIHCGIYQSTIYQGVSAV